MKRTQIQLDERTYEALRRRAFEKGCSMSSLVRELMARSLGTSTATQQPTIKDLPLSAPDAPGKADCHRFQNVTTKRWLKP